jgi:hypothetical protein
VESIADSLADALDRLDEFKAVSAGRPAEEMMEALACLREAVGIDDDAIRLIHDRFTGETAEKCHTGQVLFGVIVGLLAASFEDDRDARSSGPVSDPPGS